MSTSTPSTASTPAPATSGPSILRGFLTGLAPVALFAAVAALTLGVTLLVRGLVASQPFLTQAPELLASLGVGLALAFAAWIAGFIWALRRQRAWASVGGGAAVATLWALTLSALLLLAPVILAIALPQHPAHPAP